jgi:hypothetical protein
MANEVRDDIPMEWRDDYLFDSSITFEQIVNAFIAGVQGMAAVDVANCLIHLMIFCRSGCPSDLQKATEYLNHANNKYYGINPDWKKGEHNEV